jgi:Zn-dependent peptidase ImmA (M78 family)
VIKFALFFLIGLTGCSSTLSLTHRISLVESENKSPKLTRVINKIKKQIKLVKFESALNDPNQIRKVTLQSGGTADPELGFCECNRIKNSCIIGISNSIENESDLFVEIVILHEIGHAFGLSHSDNSNDIMYKTLKRKSKLDINRVYRFIEKLKSLEKNQASI